MLFPSCFYSRWRLRGVKSQKQRKKKELELELELGGEIDRSSWPAEGDSDCGIGQVLRPIAVQWVAQLELIDNPSRPCRQQHRRRHRHHYHQSPLGCCAQKLQIRRHGAVIDRPMVANAVTAANMTQSLLRSVLHLLPLLLLLTAVAVGAAPLSIKPTGVGSSSNSQTGRCPASSNFASSPSVGVSQSVKGASSSSVAPCRHFFKQRYGTLSTPGFPSAFPVPFICSWIIDATAFEPDSFITLYLTQMYLTRGVQVGWVYFNLNYN